MKIMDFQNQMELRFEMRPPESCPARPVGRRARAHWWFTQMRVMVDRAFDWSHAPGRPEQLPLDLPQKKR